MARTIKFALEMKDGVKVRRTLEEIREHFDLGKVLEHFASGKLAEWLEDRGYEEEAEGLRALDSHSPDFPRQLCAVLGVEYTGGQEVDMDAAIRLHEKRSFLRQMTEDEEIIDRAAEVAFSQEDLAERLRAGAEVIYLCGEAFTIPLEAAGKKYVGIGKKPRVSIAAESPKELTARNILFENVELPENLRHRLPDAAELKQILADSHPTHQDSGKVWLVKKDSNWLQDYEACIRSWKNSEAEIQKAFKEHKETLINLLNNDIDNSACTHEKYSEEDIIRHVYDGGESGYSPYYLMFAIAKSWLCLTKDSLVVYTTEFLSHKEKKDILYKDIISVKLEQGLMDIKFLKIDYRDGDGKIDSVKLYPSGFASETIEQLEKYLNRVRDLFAGDAFGEIKEKEGGKLAEKTDSTAAGGTVAVMDALQSQRDIIRGVMGAMFTSK